MAIGDMPIFAALKNKMQWHQTRQSLLAENVANAETPGYRGRDLAAFTVKDHQRRAGTDIATAATNARHFSVAGDASRAMGARTMNSFEIMPEGNGVTL